MLDKLAPVTRALSRGLLLAQKHSPELLTAAGIVGGIAAAVLGARATLKTDEVTEELKRDRDVVKTMQAGNQYAEPKEYAQDITYVYIKATKSYIKIYWPAITLGAASIVCILGAHNILKQRNAMLLIAYKTLETSFNEYRSRVVQDFGEEVDHKYIGGVRNEIDESGETAKVVEVIDHKAISPYVRYFDEFSERWQRDAEMNFMFLVNAQNIFNNRLRARGHVFLNEVLEYLGFNHSSVGALVGWVWNGDGDNYIDFGIESPANSAKRAFINGDEYSIRLDFNVDGVIYNLLEE